MRDLGWFVLSALVVVFWLSFGPRVAAADLTFDDPAAAAPQQMPVRRYSQKRGLAGLLMPLLGQQADGLDRIRPRGLDPQALTVFQPTSLAERLTTPKGRLVRCDNGQRYCLVAYRVAQ